MAYKDGESWKKLASISYIVVRIPSLYYYVLNIIA